MKRNPLYSKSYQAAPGSFLSLRGSLGVRTRPFPDAASSVRHILTQIPPLPMMNLHSPPTSEPLQDQARASFARGEYELASQLYEQLAEAEPTQIAHRWWTGLALLLLGQEEEAQLVWTLAMAEGDENQVEQWVLDLFTLLQAEAETQEAHENLQKAWLIRQHMRELAPDDIENLLRSLQLSLQLEQFDPEALLQSGLIDSLQWGSFPQAQVERLTEVVQLALEQVPAIPVVADLTAAALPYCADPEFWTELMLQKGVRVNYVFHNRALGIHYLNLGLTLDPNHFRLLWRLGYLYQDDFQCERGTTIAQQAIQAAQTPVQKVMGNALLLRGLMMHGAKWDEALHILSHEEQCIETLLTEYQIDPDVPMEPSMVCTPLGNRQYLIDDPAGGRSLQNRLASLYHQSLSTYVERHLPHYQPIQRKPVVRSAPQKKLRIGYLSRCLREHSVGWLSRWVFQHYDRDRFEVFALFHLERHLSSFSEDWFARPATDAYFLDGDAAFVASEIQKHEIDILVDLDTITVDSTCAVMALKPAPIQATWLGMDASGLPTVDYFLVDPYVLPDNAQDYYTETLWRLPQTYIAVDGFEVGIPSLRRDQLGIPADAVIYFSAQVSYKRHPETVRLQMRILKEVPNSYFLIKGLGDQQAIQEYFLRMAEEEGVSGDRLRFLPRDHNELVHRANLGIADVVLDTFPYNGATTTMETLWMGIPMVTRVGQQFASRNSYAMMTNAGITEGIAHTAEEYVAWGVRLGQDAALRQQIHTRLLQSRQTAPLWNGRQFTRDLEAAYEQMWQRYCS